MCSLFTRLFFCACPFWILIVTCTLQIEWNLFKSKIDLEIIWKLSKKNFFFLFYILVYKSFIESKYCYSRKIWTRTFWKFFMLQTSPSPNNTFFEICLFVITMTQKLIMLDNAIWYLVLNKIYRFPSNFGRNQIVGSVRLRHCHSDT